MNLFKLIYSRFIGLFVFAVVFYFVQVTFPPIIAIILGGVVVFYLYLKLLKTISNSIRMILHSGKGGTAYKEIIKDFRKEKYTNTSGLNDNINSDETKLDIQKEIKKQKKLENQLKSDKEYTLEKISELNLADAIFYIILHNKHMRLFGKSNEFNINIYELFPSESNEIIDNWIYRANKLANSYYHVGVACMTWIRADKNEKEEAYARYLKIKEAFVNDNPGFSDSTYEYAIQLGCTADR
ncbi:MAG: hypothetical protein ACOY46_11560 [Bacillota bacterium]